MTNFQTMFFAFAKDMNRSFLACLLSSNVVVGILAYGLGSRAGLQTEQDYPNAAIVQSGSLLAPRDLQHGEAAKRSAPNLENSPPLQPQAVAGQGLRHRLAGLMQRVDTMDDAAVLATLKQIRHQPAGPDKRLAQEVLLARYGELDPETALTYVGTLVGDDYRAGVQTVMSAWTNADPVAAADYFLDHQDDFGVLDDELQSMAGTVAAEWARQDSSAALDWATDLPAEISGEAYGRIAAELVRQDPTRAIAALSAMEPGFEQTEMLESMIDQWAYQDPQSAASWTLSNTDGGDQLRAVTSLMNAWMTTDPMDASTWLADLDNGAVKDTAILSLMQSRAVARDPEAAAAWSSVIQDDALRQILNPTPSP